jgi:ankyrin repeat protein
VREGKIKITEFLIDRGANHDLPDFQAKRPIYYAIQADKYDMVDFLVKKGVDLKAEDKKNMTPTHFANKHNKKEILELLLANGGEPLKSQNVSQIHR